MSHDVVADGLNMMLNAKRAGKEVVVVTKMSNLFIEILKIMKQKDVIKKYKINPKEKSVEITLGDFTQCKSVKPRFTAQKDEIDKYMRRYLPARNMGTMIISTNKGLMTQEEALEEGIGGCIIAFFY